MAIMGVIRRSNRVSKKIYVKLHLNYTRYYDCLFENKISDHERFIMAEKWWTKDMNLIAKELKLETLLQIIQDDELVMRENFLKFLELITSKNIPVIIFSAGIGNFIETYLKFKNIDTENIYVVSNFIDFNSRKFRPPLIHSLNKHQIDITALDFWPKIALKTDVLVIGDYIDDHMMADSIGEERNIYKIGFLNKADCPVYRQKYLQAFDIIFPSNAGFDVPLEIIKELK